MVLLDSAGGIAVEYLFQIVIASLLGIFVLWRLSVAAGGKTEGLHPFKRSFYSALLAEYYLNKAKKITPKKGSILDHLRIVDLCDKAISFFPLIGAYRLKIDSYFQLGINEETSQQERFKYLNQVAKTCNDLIETHPQSFHAYSTKAWYLLQSKGHKTPESFSYDVNEAFTLGKEALKHIEKDDKPEYYSWYCTLANVALQKRDYQEALRLTEKANASKWAYGSKRSYFLQSVALTYLRKWEDAISTFKETDGHYKKTISNIAAKGQEFEEQLRSGAISESEYDHKIEQLLFAENGRWWNEKVLS